MSDNQERGFGSLRGWFIASVGINLFLAGCTAAVLFQISAPFEPSRQPPPFGHDPAPGQGALLEELGEPPPPPDPDFPLGRLSDRMSPEDAKAFRAIYEQGAGALRASSSETRGTMAELGDLLGEDKPDPAKLDALLGKIQAADTRMHKAMAAILRRVVAEMSPTGRRQIADHLDRMPKHGPPGPMRP